MEEAATTGRRQTALVGIACLWGVAVWLAVGAAIQVAAATTITPLVLGLLLAGRWRRYDWAIGFGVLLMFAVLGSGFFLIGV